VQRYGGFADTTIAISWHFAYQTFGIALLFARFSRLLTPKTNIFAKIFLSLHAKACENGRRLSNWNTFHCVRLAPSLRRNIKKERNMSIDTYKLTSMEEPTDEMLAQLMHEAAEEASRTNREATTRFFEEIKQAAAAF
jgi:hypothetical protein